MKLIPKEAKEKARGGGGGGLLVDTGGWRWYIPPLQMLQGYVPGQLASFHQFLSAKNLEILSKVEYCICNFSVNKHIIGENDFMSTLQVQLFYKKDIYHKY